jgi:hypothetical protein
MGAKIFWDTSTLGQKVLRKSQRSTDVDGLVTLTETYTIKTEDIATVEPDRNTSHSTFSSSATKYPRMLVETTRVEPLDGGFSQLVVTYVGLDYTTGLPPAFITTVGQPGVGIFGADAAIVVKYITQDSLFDTLKGANVTLSFGSSNLTLPTKRFLPPTINGTAMPPNPRVREYRRTKNQSEQIAAQDASFSKNYTGTYFYAGRSYVFYPEYEWVYAGYVQTAISFQRRGLFNQIEEQFTEYFRGSSIFYQSDGTINIRKVNSFSDVNYTF